MTGDQLSHDCKKSVRIFPNVGISTNFTSVLVYDFLLHLYSVEFPLFFSFPFKLNFENPRQVIQTSTNILAPTHRKIPKWTITKCDIMYFFILFYWLFAYNQCILYIGLSKTLRHIKKKSKKTPIISHVTMQSA